MKKTYVLAKKRSRLGENTLTAAIFEKSRKPHRKKPFIYKKEDSEQLITVPTKKPLRDNKLPAQLQFDKLDKLLSADVAATSKPQQFSNLPHDIVRGNFEQINADKVQQKYKDTVFPLPKSKATLKKRSEKHLDIIPRILAGEEELSFYYTLALEQRKHLKHLTMTLEERWDIKWEKYVGGFYGLQRQLFISTLIQTRFNDLLAKSSNKTVKYWTPDMFATYVLANEIIIQLVMEDMDVTKPEAEKLLKDTIDYGCKLADDQEFADDLDFGELIAVDK